MTDPVSVYVPAHNAERTLHRCLQSICSQTVPFDEVFVIDDGSTDRTAEIASTFKVEVARNPENRGLAATRNVGLSMTCSPHVAAVDSDCVLADDWLETLSPYMRRPEVAAVGGALFERHTSSLADLWRSKHLALNWGPAPVTNPPFLFGCNTLSKREAILSVGGYNETLLTAGDDVDISRRLNKMGWTLLYDPRARAFHLQQDTPTSVMSRWWRYNNPWRKALNRTEIARNILRNLIRAVLFFREDVRDSSRLLLLDFAFPFAQAYLDVRGRYGASGVRRNATGNHGR